MGRKDGISRQGRRSGPTPRRSTVVGPAARWGVPVTPESADDFMLPSRSFVYAAVAGLAAVVGSQPTAEAGLFGWWGDDGYVGPYTAAYWGWDSYTAGYAPWWGGCCLRTACYSPSSCGCSPCDCAPCGGGCSGGGCATGGCASGNCSGGGCSMNAAPLGGEPTPDPNFGAAPPPSSNTRPRGGRTYERDPADPDNFEPPATGTPANPRAPKRPFGAGQGSETSNPLKDRFQERTGPEAGAGAGTGTAGKTDAESRRIVLPNFENPNSLIAPQQPAEAVPVNDNDTPPVKNSKPMEDKNTGGPVVRKDRMLVRSRAVAPSLARTPATTTPDWSALPASDRAIR